MQLFEISFRRHKEGTSGNDSSFSQGKEVVRAKNAEHAREIAEKFPGNMAGYEIVGCRKYQGPLSAFCQEKEENE